MALDIDGFATLAAIAARPDAFPDIRVDAAKAARALVVRQVTAKGLSLAGLRGARDAIGPETFALVIDGLTDSQAKGLIGRLDRGHPELKRAAAGWLRRHIVNLADGAEPAPKAGAPRGAARKPAAPKAGATRALGASAFAAVWDGKDHDPKPSKGKKKGG